MEKSGDKFPPCTVTASYSIKLKRPTPLNSKLLIQGRVVEIDTKSVKVELILKADEKVCATGEGLFVAIHEGHPAYHRWH